jgi:hypothetical protein
VRPFVSPSESGFFIFARHFAQQRCHYLRISGLSLLPIIAPEAGSIVSSEKYSGLPNMEDDL